jgi:ribosome-binding ATPase YchF (GTP1/OBG family)
MTDESVKQEFMDMYGMKESAVDSIVNQSFDLLGLDLFFTMGKSEVRAWPTEKKSTARYEEKEMAKLFKSKLFILYY